MTTLRLSLTSVAAAITWALLALSQPAFGLTDGLSPIRLKGADEAFLRPSTSFSQFSKVRLDPVHVEFDPGWNPHRIGSHLHLRQNEKDAIKSAVAGILREAMVEELTANGRFTLTSTAGPDVLRVSASIVDLVVTAPDSFEPGIVHVYAHSVGGATLRLELRDGVTGEVLGRLKDWREATTPSGHLERVDRFRNYTDAERVAFSWAQLVSALIGAAH